MPLPDMDKWSLARAVFLIVATPLALIAGIAWAGGWLSPERHSGNSLVDALEYNAGKHPGYRRAHAKGLCFSGRFNANGAGTELSAASLLASGSYPVIGRFSTGGSDPFATDGRNVFHAMALQITAPDGQIWRMALDHTPIFPVATVDAFIALQRATRPDPKTGKPDAMLVTQYMSNHPETRAFQNYLDTAPLPDSFANATYYSINAFRLTSKEGRQVVARWAMVPLASPGAIDKSELASLPVNFLFDEMLSRLAKGPAQWRMEFTIAAPDDVTNNATVRWPSDRRIVNAGTLTISRAESEEKGTCRDITFDPTLVPAGVDLSNDPLLAARAAAYSASFIRRAEEGAGPSAIGKERAVEAPARGK